MKEKHSVIIMGKDEIKTWKIRFRNSYYDITDIGITFNYNEVKIWDGEIDRPLLRVNETLYIDSIDEFVVIEEVIRTTSDKVIYKTNCIMTKTVSETLELDRLEAIEEWMSYYGHNTFYDLNYWSPTEMKERLYQESEKNKEKYKWIQKWVDIKGIIKKKYK